MKLRIYRNSIRFRLTPSDVAALLQSSSLVESSRFGADAEFSYGIYLRAGIKTMRASLEANRISVEIPARQGRIWGESDTVGLRHAQDIGGTKTLEILIEKDFECLESQASEPGEIRYPNPNKACAAGTDALRR